jgi:RNA polymerase sigma-70 factor (ECF subfamily)
VKPLDISQLFDQFGEAMYRYLTVKLGSPDDAEDVLQEVFYRLLKYSIRLRFVHDLRAFAFRTARNEANRFLQRKLKGENAARPEAAFVESMRRSYSGSAGTFELPVAAALARIPDEQREVIVLRIFEGLSFSEIAAVSGQSINTAASRYRYGIEKMRALIGGEGG